MPCAECERLRAKLSPLENKVLTAAYKAVEPVSWYGDQLGSRGGEVAVVFQLKDAWEQAFGTTPNPRELTELGRTLQALGFERTKRNGLLYFAMPYEEYERVYFG